MALFFPDDASYDETVRMTGFYRYRQLLSLYTFGWVRTNLMTLLGCLPLAAGIALSVLSSSLLLLLPLSLLGGMLFGPFYAAMVDGILRGMRDAPGRWWPTYRRGFRQNLRDSLLPGALLGLAAGVYAFLVHILWSTDTRPGGWTLFLLLFSALLVLILQTLYWPQMVLFRQSVGTRLVNALLFTSKYLWRVLLAAGLQVLWLLLLILFAPWTTVLIPFFGFWLPLFLAIFFLYRPLDEELQIEERIAEAMGYPRQEEAEADGQAEDHP